MTESSAPVLLISADGIVQALPALPPTEEEWSVSAFRSEWWRSAAYYHRDGRRYSVTSATPVRPLGLLARLFGTTQIRVRQELTDVGYSLTELKAAFAAAIRADDDSLTQFHDADELLAALDDATSFDDVVAVVTLAASDDDDDDTSDA